MVCRDNIQAVDEHGFTMAPREEIPRSCTNGTVALPSQDIHCRPVPAFRKAKDEPRSVVHIALYHYVLRSKEDFAIKMERGGGDSFKRDPSYFDRTDRYVSRSASLPAVCHVTLGFLCLV